MPDERELFEALERWLAGQPYPPTLVDVIATGNIDLFAAYILKGLRQATAQAVEERERVAWVRGAVLDAYEGDAVRTEAFLRSPHPLLGGETPLQKALRSDEDAEEAIALVRVDFVGVVLRVLAGLAEAWCLSNLEQARLLGVESAWLEAWQVAAPDQLPTEVLERASLLLGIFKAINTLLPVPERADAWIRRANAAPLFAGRSALELMMEGAHGLRRVRDFLIHQVV